MITNLVFDFDKASKATTKNDEKANSNDAIKKQRKSRVKAQTQRSLNAHVRVQIDVRIF
jgi:hypothetical protein